MCQRQPVSCPLKRLQSKIGLLVTSAHRQERQCRPLGLRVTAAPPGRNLSGDISPAGSAGRCSVASPARDVIESGGPMYLTAAELAHQLHVDDKTVYRWAQQEPSMPVLRIKGVVRFPRERVLRWLADHEQGQARPRGSRAAPADPHITSAKSPSTQDTA
jgi:excisionase family DNA binding protein